MSEIAVPEGPAAATAVAIVERAAAAAAPGLMGVTAELQADLREFPTTSEEGVVSPSPEDILLGHGRACLVALLQRGGSDALATAATDLSRWLRFDEESERLSVETRARLDEWSRIPAMAVSRRGSSTTEQALNSHRGKARRVVELLAVHEGSVKRKALADLLVGKGVETGEDSNLSHILRVLDDAGLIDRWQEGRDVFVEITGDGMAAIRDTASLRVAAKAVGQVWSRKYSEPIEGDAGHYGRPLVKA